MKYSTDEVTIVNFTHHSYFNLSGAGNSNILEGEPGKSGIHYPQYGAFCLEPQGYPDAPNHENFQSIRLKPEETYSQEIVYCFTVEAK